jgi:hypothetical protein
VYLLLWGFENIDPLLQVPPASQGEPRLFGLVLPASQGEPRLFGLVLPASQGEPRLLTVPLTQWGEPTGGGITDFSSACPPPCRSEFLCSCKALMDTVGVLDEVGDIEDEGDASIA